MKSAVVCVCLLFAAQVFAQSAPGARVTVFYFGGSDCPFSMDERNVANINRMRADLPKTLHGSPTKFVLVVMDQDLERGIQFSRKYPTWDEISIGRFYDNELMLAHVNRSALPGVPHIMIYRDALATGKFNIPTISDRTLVLDLVGESAIAKWIDSGYPLKQ